MVLRRLADMASWVDPSEPIVDAIWPDAPADEDTLTLFLNAAQGQCEAFAPVLAEGQPVPDNYRLAVLYQARALQRSSVAGGNNQLGEDFPVTLFPMDLTVKNLLRPAKGIPVVL